MRWFQVQKNCYVGLNSGRPEKIRKETLESINQLGKELRLKFTDEFLFLNQLSWEQGVAESKVAGLNYFKNKNFLPIAFIDNEPSILDEIANSYKSRDLLLLHADTIYQHKRKHGPKAKITRGKVYDLKSIIYEWMLPKEIDLVWHGVNDDLNMRQFLASPVTWCECDIRLDAITQLPYLRHDSFQETSLDKDDEKPPLLKDYLEKIKKHEKKIKLDFKQGEPLLTKCIDLFKEYNFSDDELWFNGNPKDIRESGFKKIAKNYPNSINQCPIDGLVFLMGLFDDDIGKILDKLCSWGINRFSLSWETKGLYKILDFLENRNNEVNVYGVPSLDAFLRAILLQPTSLTSDFNFPQWNYFGRGSGKGLKHHNFEIKKKNIEVKSDQSGNHWLRSNRHNTFAKFIIP